MRDAAYAPMTAEEMIFALPVKDEPVADFGTLCWSCRKAAASSRPVLTRTAFRSAWALWPAASN